MTLAVFLLGTFLSVVQAQSQTDCSDATLKHSDASILNLVDNKSGADGFALYRYWRPNKTRVHQVGDRRLNELEEVCLSDLDEVFVLDGSATSGQFEADCASIRNSRGLAGPGPKVVYNEAQLADADLKEDFLRMFDSHVERAQKEGRKIGVRCAIGLHRTGRLIAYYRMRHMKPRVSAAEAWDELDKFEDKRGLSAQCRFIFKGILFGQVDRMCSHIAGCRKKPAKPDKTASSGTGTD